MLNNYVLFISNTRYSLHRHPSYHCYNESSTSWLYVNRGFFGEGVIGYQEEIDNMIDCGDNEELFLALAALRDDSNEHQWFIAQNTMLDENYNGEITVYYEDGEWLLWNEYSFMEDIPSGFRKASVGEIIEHYKNK